MMTTAGALAARAWLEASGLDVGKQRQWWVEIAIPCQLHAATSLEIAIYPVEWAVKFRHLGKLSHVRVTDEKFTTGPDELELFPLVTELSQVGRIASTLSARHGIQLLRDKAAVRSNVPRASTAVRTWLALLPP